LKGAERRWSYANVMSTLAVFLALGGSALAVTKIDGKELKDRTVAGKKLKSQTIGGGKLKQATITGKQVKEGTLGKVPSAKSADAATTAATANTASTATTAITANNSLALGGLPPSAYARSSPPAAVSCSAPLDAASPQRVFSSSERNFDLSAGNGGLVVSNDSSHELTGTTLATGGGSDRFRIAAGASQAIGMATGGLDTVISAAANPARSTWVHCQADAGTAFCWGLRAGP
jgi:hypothetical protein